MKTTILTSILFAGILLQANSQSLGTSYTTAIGVKVYPASLSVKHFVQQNNAIEGLLTFWESGNRLTGLYEIHGDINNAAGLKWYIGPGAHIGFWNDTFFLIYYSELFLLDMLTTFTSKYFKNSSNLSLVIFAPAAPL